MKIQTMNKGKAYFVLIPKSIIQGFDWKKGDILKYRISGKSRIELSKEE